MLGKILGHELYQNQVHFWLCSTKAFIRITHVVLGFPLDVATYVDW